MTRTNKIVCIALVVTFAIMLTGFGVYNLIEAEQDRLFREEVKKYSEPYEVEKAKCTVELYNLERELNKLLPCGATMTMVVTSPRKMLYDNVYPIFSGTSEYNSKNENLSLAGTICLSPTDLPGMDGNITVDEFSEMVEAGWSTALYVSHKGASDITNYLSTAKTQFSALGIDMPNTAYFISGAYSTNHDGSLMSYGIRNVIHHEESGYNLIGTDLESGMWRVGDLGWNTTGVANSAFTALLAGSGNLVFSIGFEEGDKSRWFVGDDMGNAAFSRMLDKFRDCVRADDMRVASLAEGRITYKAHIDKYIELAPTLEPRRKALQAEVDRLNTILFRIYAGDFSVVEGKEDA